MNLFTGILIFTLSTNVFSFENSYVKSSIDRNPTHFISMEVVLSIKEGIANYNLNRGNLPEAKKIDYKYVLVQGDSKAEFTIPMLYFKSFRLNNKLIRFKDKNDLEQLFIKKTSLFNIGIISTAFADEVGDIKDNSRDNQILVASILEISKNIEDLKLIDNFTSKPKINFEQVLKKIQHYKNSCEETKVYYNKHVGKTRASLIETLADEDLQVENSLHDLLVKSSELSKLKKDKLSDKIENKLDERFEESSCEKQFKPFFKSGLMNLTHYSEGDETKVDTVSVPKFCASLLTLKQCLAEIKASDDSITEARDKKIPTYYDYGSTDKKSNLSK